MTNKFPQRAGKVLKGKDKMRQTIKFNQHMAIQICCIVCLLSYGKNTTYIFHYLEDFDSGLYHY